MGLKRVSNVMGELWTGDASLTFGLCEITLLDTALEGFVEEGIE